MQQEILRPYGREFKYRPHYSSDTQRNMSGESIIKMLTC